MAAPRVLVALSAKDAVDDAERTFVKDGLDVVTADEARVAMQFLNGARAFDAFIFDLDLLPNTVDAKVVLALRDATCRAPVTLLVSAERVELARRVVAGAEVDIVPQSTPWNLVSACVRASISRRGHEPGATFPLDDTAPTQKTLREIERAARVDVAVLLKGEAGVDVRSYARHLHRRSPRCARPFVAVNCDRVPADEIDTLLFGDDDITLKKGDEVPQRVRAGAIARAHGGTLFLQEIDRLPLSTQSRLARVLDEREIWSKARGPVRVDIRIVSSTTNDLSQISQNGGFRNDLLYRMGAFAVRLPPLRERRGGIPARAEAILESMGDDLRLTDEALACLTEFHWPANDHELDLVVARAALIAPGGLIERQHLPSEISGATTSTADRFPLLSLDEYEHRALMAALEETEGNVTQAAKLLGIGRATFYRKAHRYGVGL